MLEKDESEIVRSQVVSSLAEIGGEEASRALETGLGDDSYTLRMEVIYSLGEVSEDRVSPGLGQVLFSDPDPLVRLEAVRKISEDDSEAAKAFLKVASKDKDSMVRTTALDALAKWE
jgi:HEAT repeat protein